LVCNSERNFKTLCNSKMKRIFNWAIGIAAMVVAIVALPDQQAKAQPGASVSFQMFYDELSPYGQWIDDPQYGYVWAPEVDNDFRPYYTDGRWAMTEYGNTWISDYDWGWAPFHYGRWTYDNYYGWIWVPGNEWGPAWVDWRSGGGYYGWAPMAPGININLSFGNNYATPYDWWTFIPCQHIYSPNYYSYWRGPRYNTTIINQTTIINNYYNNRYVYGPRRNDIERYTGGRVNIYNIRNEQRPGRTSVRRNEIALYRPQVVQSPRSGLRTAPRNVVQADRSVGNGNYRDNRGAFDRGRQERNTQAQPIERANVSQRNMDRDPFQRDRGNQIDSRPQQQDRSSMRNDAMRAQRDQELMQRQNEQRMQVDRQRAERENNMVAQREMAQRQNDQRVQMERQRIDRENAQRVQMEQARRDNEVRMQEMRGRQQMMEQRQQQMQMQREQQQRMQVERQQQREWRRPEPQMQRSERPQMQRTERPQMERAQPSGDRGRPFGRGR